MSKSFIREVQAAMACMGVAGLCACGGIGGSPCTDAEKADPDNQRCCCHPNYGGDGCQGTTCAYLDGASASGSSSGGGCTYEVDPANLAIILQPGLSLYTTEEPVGTGLPDACQAFEIRWGYKSLMKSDVGPPEAIGAAIPRLIVKREGGEVLRSVVKPWSNLPACGTENRAEAFEDGIAIADTYVADLTELPISAQNGTEHTGISVQDQDNCTRTPGGGSGGSSGGPLG